MKKRKHHNNKGKRGIKTGMYRNQLKRIAEKLGIKFGSQKNGGAGNEAKEV